MEKEIAKHFISFEYDRMGLSSQEALGVSELS
jgi:hypothetical protein